ncbi:hypothetical protein Tco_0702937 [Tanacetum coccineum]|uniref:Uncharacterized protein n=1 Tax=Tanacetum coccineum TaxID=301880 RepID=A0ABQ4XYY6_9ASTR
MPDEMIHEFYDKHYNQLPPLMADKVHQEKLKRVRKKSKTRLKASPSTKSRTTFLSQSPSVFSRLRLEESEPSYRENSKGTNVFARLGEKERNVFTRLGGREPDVFSRLGSKDSSLREQWPDLGSHIYASTRLATRDPEKRRRHDMSLIQSYITCSSEKQREIEKEWDTVGRTNRIDPILFKEAIPSESKNKGGRHWKSWSKKQKTQSDSDELSQPYKYEETDHFTPHIRNFVFPKRIRMSGNVKIYDSNVLCFVFSLFVFLCLFTC